MKWTCRAARPPRSGQRGGGSRHPGRDPHSGGSRPGV